MNLSIPADESAALHLPTPATPVPPSGARALAQAPVLRSKMTPLFLASLEARGIDLAPLLAEYALPADAPRQADLSLPLSRFRALSDRVAEIADDTLLGLHTAIDLRPGSYGIIEFLLRSAATPRDALRQLLRFVPLFNSLLTFSLVEEEDCAIVEGTIAGEPLGLGRHGNEFVLAVFVGLGRQLAGPAWSPDQVLFPHARPADVDELNRFFRASTVTFGARTLGLRFKVPDLAKAVSTGDDALHAFLEREATTLVAKSATDDLTLARDAIRAQLRTGEPSVGDVARTLGTSPRTLQRRFCERGTSFRELTDDVREGLARQHMADPALTIKEIAGLLGYADVRAFGRAFKRWTGQSPGTARVAMRSA